MSFPADQNDMAAGWFSDPTSLHELRYWDGSRWTDYASDAGVVSVDRLSSGGSSRPDERFLELDLIGSRDEVESGVSGLTSAMSPRRRGRRALVVAGAAVVLLLGVGLSTSDDSAAVSSDEGERAVTNEDARSIEADDNKTATTAVDAAAAPPARNVATSPAASASPASPDAQTVRSITDGDTFVLADGRRVRLAQVDAPETNECFGSESTAALRTMIDGDDVNLRRPPTGSETDRYGRTLADVMVGGVSVNEALVASGAAEWYEEFASEDADLARRLQASENSARRAGLGLWAACTAPPSPPAPTSAPAPSAPPVTQALVTPTTGGASSSGNCHPAYPDDCIPPAPPDLDCADIGHKVHVDRVYGDPHGLDGNNDGWGCESYG